MKKRTALLILLAAPAWAEDSLPQFPKIAPPDPLPEAACDHVDQPAQWALGDWTGPNLTLHVEADAWTIAGAIGKNGTHPQLEACRLTLTDDQTPVFAAVRGQDGQMTAVWWNAAGKARRITLHKS